MGLPVVEFNYWAIAVSSVVSFIFGWLWYSPILFGKVWQKLSKKKMGAGKSFAFLMISNFIGVIITVQTIEYLVVSLGANTLIDALNIGFWPWLGFFAFATLLGDYLWEGKPFKVYLIAAGYWLINLEIISLILTFWR